jgi:diamine N-acetyltransferase
VGRVVRGLELQAFTEGMTHPRLALPYLADQERRRCIRPEWRFAWMDDDGRFGSRVVFWAGASATQPRLIDIVYDGGDGAVGVVLEQALHALGVADQEVAYVPDRSLVDGRVAQTEPPALEALGFELIATQTRLAHVGPVPARAAPEGITVATATDDVMLALIPAIAVGSADRATRDRDAVRELRMLRALDHDRAWWQVAKDQATGEPLGFVAPTRTDDGGHVIAFIGVTPAARGRGLGGYLLARGTASLRRGARDIRIVADVDDSNAPMLRAAAAIGYVPFGRRAHYRRFIVPRTDAVSLREITATTVRAICALAPRLDQARFVAPNAVSLAEALFSAHAWYRAIYAGDEPVGFVMLELVPDKVPYLWRFMIDGRYQSKGYGRDALALALAHVRSLGETAIETSVVQGEGTPQPFYERLGFALTGAIEEGELVMRREL